VLLFWFFWLVTFLLQGHHMALALKERNTSELLGRNDAIKALKKENDLLES
jgi:hypothetical protein